MTLPILTVELEAPRERRAFVMAIDPCGACDSNPFFGGRLRLFSLSYVRSAEDRATLGSDPSAAERSVRHDRPPHGGRRPLMALVPVLPLSDKPMI